MITDQLFKSFIQNNIKYAQIWGGANTDHDINLFPDSAFILWYLHISGVCDCLWRDAVGHAHGERSEDTPSSRRQPPVFFGWRIIFFLLRWNRQRNWLCWSVAPSVGQHESLQPLSHLWGEVLFSDFKPEIKQQLWFVFFYTTDSSLFWVNRKLQLP